MLNPVLMKIRIGSASHLLDPFGEIPDQARDDKVCFKNPSWTRVIANRDDREVHQNDKTEPVKNVEAQG